jgi:hypothetical protein
MVFEHYLTTFPASFGVRAAFRGCFHGIGALQKPCYLHPLNSWACARAF